MYLAILNQKVYPGAGDWDDCWAVATIWAYRAATDATSLPTVPEFRAAAKKPDKPGPTGGNITDIMRAVGVLWPHAGVVEYERPDWPSFSARVRAGDIASLALDSGLLPRQMRFGFDGSHQVGVAYVNGFLMANPLAPQGSEPIPIKETVLRDAALGIANGWVLAALFPRRDDVNLDRITYQWWTANGTDGVLRAAPVRSEAPVETLPAGTRILSIAEYVSPDGNDWRAAEWPIGSGTVRWFLRKGPGIPRDHDFIAQEFATFGDVSQADFDAVKDKLAKAVTIAKTAAADVAAL